MNNLIQYASAICAYGAKLAYDTNTNTLEVAEYPNRKNAKKILDAALADIKLFEDTSNFEDGLSVIALADIVDNDENPVTKSSRLNILTNIGIMREGRYVKQILERIKTNRSWHISEVPNDCSFFGELCTHRGISDNSHRRGRKSERDPHEYHTKSSRGIAREQLVTPALELMYDNIPADMLISEIKTKTTFNLDNIEDLPQEDLNLLINRIQGVLDAKTVSKT